jgi:hypothetical protein
MEECKVVEQRELDPNDWRVPFIRYIKNKEEPNDKTAVERIARQSVHYAVIGEVLYNRGTAGVFMKCIDSGVRKRLLEEIHAGQCGVHAASMTLVGRPPGQLSIGQQQRKMHST